MPDGWKSLCCSHAPLVLKIALLTQRNSSIPMQLNQQPQQSNCLSQISAWWRDVSFGSKFIICTCVLIYVIDLFANQMIASLFVNIPILVYQGQIWRLVICQFINYPLFGLLFGLWTTYSFGSVHEKLLGTSTFLIDLMIKCLCVQCLTVLIAFPCLFLFPNLAALPCHGLWDLALVYISTRCFSNPNADSQFLCFPILIRNLYYPFAIILFSLFFAPSISPLSSVLVGWIEYKHFNGMLYRPTQALKAKIENSFLFSAVSKRADFLKSPIDFHTSIQDQSAPAQPNEPNHVPFQSKGVKIGSDYGSGMPAQMAFQMQQLQISQNQSQQMAEVLNEQEESTKQDLDQEAKEGKKQNYDKLGDDLV